MWLKNIKLFTRLTKKNKLWKWQKEQKILFKELKERSEERRVGKECQ